MQRFIFVSDLHGDRQDPAAVRALLRFSSSFKPHHRIFGGDLFDLRSTRRGASPEEASESVLADVDAGLQFLTEWRPTTLLWGNHDDRINQMLDHRSGPVRDLGATILDQFCDALAQIKCQDLPYHKSRGVFRLGHLKCLHGFFCGANAARQHATIYGSCLFGHVHAIDEATSAGLERRAARAVGCLCDLDMDYAATRPNSLRQQHGFAYGVLNERTGHYWVWQAEPMDGIWVFPSEMVTHRG